MKGRDQGRIHGPKGVGAEIFWLVTENSLSRYQKRGFCNPNLEGVERYFRPNFQKWEGDDRPHLTPPGLLRPWRWPAMTRTFHFYDVLMTCKRTRQCQTWFIVTCQNYNGFYIVYFSAPPSQKCVTIWSELTKQKKTFWNLRKISS